MVRVWWFSVYCVPSYRTVLLELIILWRLCKSKGAVECKQAMTIFSFVEKIICVFSAHLREDKASFLQGALPVTLVRRPRGLIHSHLLGG